MIADQKIYFNADLKLASDVELKETAT